jgi:hypothetical protein
MDKSIEIIAYFETSGFGYAEEAGRYSSEDEYIKDLPRLEEEAKANGFEHITESVIIK